MDGALETHYFAILWGVVSERLANGYLGAVRQQWRYGETRNIKIDN
jgi:hypothetical protein